LARHQFVVLSIAALALASSLWFLLDVLETTHNQTFGVASFENRFNDLRKTVQPHTVYGYVSDNPANDASALAEFHLTQYTLAPAIIKPSPNENLVIVNYHSKDLDMKLLQKYHLQPLASFGNGVELCRGAKQQ
jgi:hypothetical protein